MMPARQAAQTAEDARLIALKTQEEAFVAAQQQNADTARLNAERDRAAADRARLSAERDSAVSAAARLAAERDSATSDAAKLAAERDSATSNAARLAAERDSATSDAARLVAENDKRSAERATSDADAARTAAEAQARNAQALVTQADREKAELRAHLREQLNVILETRESARGLIVNLSDVLFDTGSATLKPGAREKLAKIGGILVSHQGLTVAVEGHTDSVGAESFNQALSEHRATAVRDYLVAQGIAPRSVGTAGFGESKPVATNDTAAGKQQNRRVVLVVAGEAIGTF
jgi:outer membrane protein OmpA-like peptidoglycan-associated protein